MAPPSPQTPPSKVDPDELKQTPIPREYRGKSEKEIFERGLALYSKAEYRQAATFFHHLTAPDFELLKNYHLGLCYVQLGDLDTGLAYYHRIREIPPSVKGIEYDRIMYSLYLNMGSAMQVLAKKKGKKLYHEAVECYRYALEISDIDPRVWNNLGNAYIELDKYADAISALNKALSLDSEYSEAHYSISLAYEFSGQYTEAIRHLKSALKGKPNNRLILNRITALEFGIGEFEEARAYCSRVLDKDPENASGLKNMVLILYNLGQYKKAWPYYQKFHSLQPDFDDKEVLGVFRDLVKKCSNGAN